MKIDRSEGYEAIGDQFVAVRSDIGAAFVRSWAAANLPRAALIADLGCGSGVPITQVLIEEGFEVYGIDASPSLLAIFRNRFPNVFTACEAAQDSAFFHRRFDAIVSIGLMFLLSEDDQRAVIRQVAAALQRGGRFLFTAPWQVCTWEDVLTRRQSRSLGTAEYERLLAASGLQLIGRHQEENHFFDTIKADT